MSCDEISATLDDYLDGTLSAERVAPFEAHLASCATCRTELAALRTILADARSLPRSVMPARDLWGGIEKRLDPHAVRRSGGRAGGRTDGNENVVSLVDRMTARPPARLPWLVAAALLLMLGGAGIARLLQPAPAPNVAFTLEQQRYTEATAALARQLSNTPEALPEETRAVVERNLAIVDAAIQEAEQALNTDPGNTALEQMVLARYEQRLALLRRATDAGRRES